jgi:hypothetical protein
MPIERNRILSHPRLADLAKVDIDIIYDTKPPLKGTSISTKDELDKLTAELNDVLVPNQIDDEFDIYPKKALLQHEVTRAEAYLKQRYLYVAFKIVLNLYDLNLISNL